MMTPVMTAFSAGTVIGPALGGALAGSIGACHKNKSYYFISAAAI